MVISAQFPGPHSLVLFAIVVDEPLIQGADNVTPGRIDAGAEIVDNSIPCGASNASAPQTLAGQWCAPQDAGIGFGVGVG